MLHENREMMESGTFDFVENFKYESSSSRYDDDNKYLSGILHRKNVTIESIEEMFLNLQNSAITDKSKYDQIMKYLISIFNRVPTIKRPESISIQYDDKWVGKTLIVQWSGIRIKASDFNFDQPLNIYVELINKQNMEVKSITTICDSLNNDLGNDIICILLDKYL